MVVLLGRGLMNIRRECGDKSKSQDNNAQNEAYNRMIE